MNILKRDYRFEYLPPGSYRATAITSDAKKSVVFNVAERGTTPIKIDLPYR